MSKTLLTSLRHGNTATIKELEGGLEFQRRLRSLGVKEGKPLRVVARHSLHGPIVVEIEHKHIAIGRGMAGKIAVETGQ